jgi:hypothetical protein
MHADIKTLKSKEKFKLNDIGENSLSLPLTFALAKPIVKTV